MYQGIFPSKQLPIQYWLTHPDIYVYKTRTKNRLVRPTTQINYAYINVIMAAKKNNHVMGWQRLK